MSRSRTKNEKNEKAEDTVPPMPPPGDSRSAPGDPQAVVFDIGLITNLVGLMRDHDLSEINLQYDAAKIKLRRGAEQTVVTLPPAGGPSYAPPPAAPAQTAAPAAQATPTPATPPTTPSAPSVPAAPADTTVLIRSEGVGTFFASPKPGAPPFVKVGDRVEPDTAVCVIEAMKMFSECTAHVSGTIVAVLVENNTPVDYGQPLFRVQP